MALPQDKTGIHLCSAQFNPRKPGRLAAIVTQRERKFCRGRRRRLPNHAGNVNSRRRVAHLLFFASPAGTARLKLHRRKNQRGCPTLCGFQRVGLLSFGILLRSGQSSPHPVLLAHKTTNCSTASPSDASPRDFFMRKARGGENSMSASLL